MLKELFGWLIAVCRRWGIGRSYDNKTGGARYGLALICGFYVIGIGVNAVFYFKPDVQGWPIKEIMGGVVLISFVLPLLIIKKIYTREVVEHYIQKYKARDELHSAKQHLRAFLFCFGGWFILAGPFYIWQLLSE